MRNEREIMTEHEYREMYAEFCAESGARMSEKEFEEFRSWRKRVEKLFDKVKSSDSS